MPDVGDLDDVSLTVLGVTPRDLAWGAWRAARPRGADTNEGDFSRWFKHESAELEAGRSRDSRYPIRALCLAAFNAAWPRPTTYEPGDGFGAWWQAVCDEARLNAQGVPSSP